MTSVVPVKPSPRCEFKKSAAVSPTVVAMTLMIQKKTVTSGTLFNICRPRDPVAMVRCAERFIGRRSHGGNEVSLKAPGAHPFTDCSPLALHPRLDDFEQHGRV